MVRRRAVACALVAVATGATAVAADGRRGQVVRVERRSAGGTPRFCAVELAGGEVVCIGPSVKVGETIVAVSMQHHGAVLRVTGVKPYSQNCPDGPAWKVDAELGTDDASALARGTRDSFTGFIDGGLDPNRSVVKMGMSPVSGRVDGANTWGVDRDGDGEADLAIEQRPCDERGNPNSAGPDFCFEVWAVQHAEWKRLRTDIFDTATCK